MFFVFSTNKYVIDSNKIIQTLYKDSIILHSVQTKVNNKVTYRTLGFMTHSYTNNFKIHLVK